MPTSVEKMLQDFLEEERVSREKGFTREAIYSALTTLTNQMLEHEKEDHRRHSDVKALLTGHGYRLQTLELAKDKLEREADNTDARMLLEAREEARALKEKSSRVHWKAVDIVIAVGLLVLGAMGSIIAVLIQRGR